MKKVIFLVDMNSFFISCETTRNSDLIDKPAAVAGNPENRTGIILTANYEARKFGIKTTMLVHEALKLCPSIVLIPPDHKFYEEKSRQVMALLASYTPIIEQNSIDEAWLDMSGCREISNGPLYAAKNIMEHIKSDLGLWCSIGISENKFLSKMASEMKKPLGITELWKNDIKTKLWPLPINSMYGVGRHTAEKLNNIGIQTIGELALFSSGYLMKILGKTGAQIHNLANGIDNSNVIPNSEDDLKSIGRSITLSKDTSDISYAKHILMQLSDEIGMQARKLGKKAHTVQIIIKYNNFKSITRQKTIHLTNSTSEISSNAIELLHSNWKDGNKIRLLGVSISGFENSLYNEQLSIFQLNDQNKLAANKINKIEATMDALREKYGNSIINRAALLKDKNK